MPLQFIEEKQIYKLERKDVKDVEVGDSKKKDFYPQAKVMCWDNEANFSIRYNKDIKDSKFNLLEDKIIWKPADESQEFKVYETIVQTNKIKNEGLEIEVKFHEKPSSKYVYYTMNTKNLVFYYQPELTQQEKDMGVVRPIHVVGSYAVYHASKRDGEYKTGKAFHIYRPKAIDSNGNEVWCKLDINVEEGYLEIEMPNEFYQDAKYPVELDPTLGYGVMGGTLSELLSGSSPCVGVLSQPAYPGRITNGSAYGFTPYAYSRGFYVSHVWHYANRTTLYGGTANQESYYGYQYYS